MPVEKVQEAQTAVKVLVKKTSPEVKRLFDELHHSKSDAKAQQQGAEQAAMQNYRRLEQSANELFGISQDGRAAIKEPVESLSKKDQQQFSDGFKAMERSLEKRGIQGRRIAAVIKSARENIPNLGAKRIRMIDEAARYFLDSGKAPQSLKTEFEKMISNLADKNMGLQNQRGKLDTLGGAADALKIKNPAIQRQAFNLYKQAYGLFSQGKTKQADTIAYCAQGLHGAGILNRSGRKNQRENISALTRAAKAAMSSKTSKELSAANKAAIDASKELGKYTYLFRGIMQERRATMDSYRQFRGAGEAEQFNRRSILRNLNSAERMLKQGKIEQAKTQLVKSHDDRISQTKSASGSAIKSMAAKQINSITRSFNSAVRYAKGLRDREDAFRNGDVLGKKPGNEALTQYTMNAGYANAEAISIYRKKVDLAVRDMSQKAQRLKSAIQKLSATTKPDKELTTEFLEARSAFKDSQDGYALLRKTAGRLNDFVIGQMENTARTFRAAHDAEKVGYRATGRALLGGDAHFRKAMESISKGEMGAFRLSWDYGGEAGFREIQKGASSHIWDGLKQHNDALLTSLGFKRPTEALSSNSFFHRSAITQMYLYSNLLHGTYSGSLASMAGVDRGLGLLSLQRTAAVEFMLSNRTGVKEQFGLLNRNLDALWGAVDAYKKCSNRKAQYLNNIFSLWHQRFNDYTSAFMNGKTGENGVAPAIRSMEDLFSPQQKGDLLSKMLNTGDSRLRKEMRPALESSFRLHWKALSAMSVPANAGNAVFKSAALEQTRMFFGSIYGDNRFGSRSMRQQAKAAEGTIRESIANLRNSCLQLEGRWFDTMFAIDPGAGVNTRQMAIFSSLNDAMKLGRRAIENIRPRAELAALEKKAQGLERGFKSARAKGRANLARERARELTRVRDQITKLKGESLSEKDMNALWMDVAEKQLVFASITLPESDYKRAEAEFNRLKKSPSLAAAYGLVTMNHSAVQQQRRALFTKQMVDLVLGSVLPGYSNITAGVRGERIPLASIAMEALVFASFAPRIARVARIALRPGKFAALGSEVNRLIKMRKLIKLKPLEQETLDQLIGHPSILRKMTTEQVAQLSPELLSEVARHNPALVGKMLRRSSLEAFGHSAGMAAMSAGIGYGAVGIAEAIKHGEGVFEAVAQGLQPIVLLSIGAGGAAISRYRSTRTLRLQQRVLSDEPILLTAKMRKSITPEKTLKDLGKSALEQDLEGLFAAKEPVLLTKRKLSEGGLIHELGQGEAKLPKVPVTKADLKAIKEEHSKFLEDNPNISLSLEEYVYRKQGYQAETAKGAQYKDLADYVKIKRNQEAIKSRQNVEAEAKKIESREKGAPSNQELERRAAGKQALEEVEGKLKKYYKEIGEEPPTMQELESIRASLEKEGAVQNVYFYIKGFLEARRNNQNISFRDYVKSAITQKSRKEMFDTVAVGNESYAQARGAYYDGLKMLKEKGLLGPRKNLTLSDFSPTGTMDSYMQYQRLAKGTSAGNKKFSVHMKEYAEAVAAGKEKGTFHEFLARQLKEKTGIEMPPSRGKLHVETPLKKQFEMIMENEGLSPKQQKDLGASLPGQSAEAFTALEGKKTQSGKPYLNQTYPQYVLDYARYLKRIQAQGGKAISFENFLRNKENIPNTVITPKIAPRETLGTAEKTGVGIKPRPKEEGTKGAIPLSSKEPEPTRTLSPEEKRQKKVSDLKEERNQARSAYENLLGDEQADSTARSLTTKEAEDALSAFKKADKDYKKARNDYNEADLSISRDEYNELSSKMKAAKDVKEKAETELLNSLVKEAETLPADKRKPVHEAALKVQKARSQEKSIEEARSARNKAQMDFDGILIEENRQSTKESIKSQEANDAFSQFTKADQEYQAAKNEFDNTAAPFGSKEYDALDSKKKTAYDELFKSRERLLDSLAKEADSLKPQERNEVHNSALELQEARSKLRIAEEGKQPQTPVGKEAPSMKPEAAPKPAEAPPARSARSTGGPAVTDPKIRAQMEKVNAMKETTSSSVREALSFLRSNKDPDVKFYAEAFYNSNILISRLQKEVNSPNPKVRAEARRRLPEVLQQRKELLAELVNKLTEKADQVEGLPAGLKKKLLELKNETQSLDGMAREKTTLAGAFIAGWKEGSQPKAGLVAMRSDLGGLGILWERLKGAAKAVHRELKLRREARLKRKLSRDERRILRLEYGDANLEYARDIYSSVKGNYEGKGGIVGFIEDARLVANAARGKYGLSAPDSFVIAFNFLKEGLPADRAIKVIKTTKTRLPPEKIREQTIARAKEDISNEQKRVDLARQEVERSPLAGFSNEKVLEMGKKADDSLQVLVKDNEPTYGDKTLMDAASTLDPGSRAAWDYYNAVRRLESAKGNLANLGKTTAGVVETKSAAKTPQKADQRRQEAVDAYKRMVEAEPGQYKSMRNEYKMALKRYSQAEPDVKMADLETRIKKDVESAPVIKTSSQAQTAAGDISQETPKAESKEVKERSVAYLRAERKMRKAKLDPEKFDEYQKTEGLNEKQKAALIEYGNATRRLSKVMPETKMNQLSAEARKAAPKELTKMERAKEALKRAGRKISEKVKKALASTKRDARKKFKARQKALEEKAEGTKRFIELDSELEWARDNKQEYTKEEFSALENDHANAKQKRDAANKRFSEADEDYKASLKDWAQKDGTKTVAQLDVEMKARFEKKPLAKKLKAGAKAVATVAKHVGREVHGEVSRIAKEGSSTTHSNPVHLVFKVILAVPKGAYKGIKAAKGQAAVEMQALNRVWKDGETRYVREYNPEHGMFDLSAKDLANIIQLSDGTQIIVSEKPLANSVKYERKGDSLSPKPEDKPISPPPENTMHQREVAVKRAEAAVGRARTPEAKKAAETTLKSSQEQLVAAVAKETQAAADNYMRLGGKPADEHAIYDEASGKANVGAARQQAAFKLRQAQLKLKDVQDRLFNPEQAPVQAPSQARPRAVVIQPDRSAVMPRSVREGNIVIPTKPKNIQEVVRSMEEASGQPKNSMSVPKAEERLSPSFNDMLVNHPDVMVPSKYVSLKTEEGMVYYRFGSLFEYKGRRMALIYVTNPKGETRVAIASHSGSEAGWTLFTDFDLPGHADKLPLGEHAIRYPFEVQQVLDRANLEMRGKPLKSLDAEKIVIAPSRDGVRGEFGDHLKKVIEIHETMGLQAVKKGVTVAHSNVKAGDAKAINDYYKRLPDEFKPDFRIERVASGRAYSEIYGDFVRVAVPSKNGQLRYVFNVTSEGTFPIAIESPNGIINQYGINLEHVQVPEGIFTPRAEYLEQIRGEMSAGKKMGRYYKVEGFHDKIKLIKEASAFFKKIEDSLRSAAEAKQVASNQ